MDLYEYGFRWYDAAIGRFTGVDPLADDAMQIDKSPYQYAWNNPIYYTDPDGRCPWCIGAIVGAAVDYGAQVAVNYATGNENPWTDVDTKSILVSAGAGATGVGLVAKAGKVFNGRTLKAAEMAIDGTVNSVQQYVNKGEVDLKETAVAVGLGQAVRSPVRDKVKAKAEPKLQQLDKQASTAQRYARNAEAKGSRPGKVQRLQNEADAATKKAANARTQTNMKAAASGASGSSGAGRVINNAQYQKEENER